MNRRLRNAGWGTVVLFLTHGLIVSTWVSRIPAIKAKLDLPNGLLGLTLLSSAAGAVCFIPYAGVLITKYGSKKVCFGSGVGFCLSIIPISMAINALTLALSLFVYGAFSASMDVAMNAQGIEVEKQMGQPTMSRFHGMFSLGAMVGAAIGGAVAARSVVPLPHFAVSAVLNTIFLVACIPLLFETHTGVAKEGARLPFNKIPPVLIALSAIGFCNLLSEGAMADWTAVYLRQSLQAGPGTAAAGYAVFSGTMALFRFVGDFITARLGPLRTVRTASLVAATGLLIALAVTVPAWSLPGFGLAGAGFSVIIPLVFGGGGRVPGIHPGAGIATVTGIGYIGFIVGPPAIGFASDLVGLRFALGIVVLCCVLSAVLARSMKSLEGPTASVPEPHEF